MTDKNNFVRLSTPLYQRLIKLAAKDKRSLKMYLEVHLEKTLPKE